MFMRYAVILNGDQNAPHLKIYTNILRDKNIPYDTISWDRGNCFEKNEFTFSKESVYKGSLYKRLWSYILFVRFIKHLVRKYNYDKLIVISPQVALFIPLFLKRKYKKKYIFDYRDLSIDQKVFFKPLMKMVLRHSYANVISSPGFKEYLPSGFNYILSHNFDIKILEANLGNESVPLPSGVIKVLTIGAIRFDANYSVIDSLGNAEGIEISFVGKGGAAPILEKYANSKGIKNIVFKGQYRKEEEGDIIRGHTMVNIFYPNKPSHISALSNRFYNSLIFKRPMLVTKGGTQGYYAERYGVGLATDNCDNLTEKIKKYLENLDYSEYEKRCDELLRVFLKDYEVFCDIVNRFIDGK